jgi:hypothetical protein
MARIDLGDDSQDDLADALRELEKQQKKTNGPDTAAPDAAAAKRRAEEEREAERERSREEVEGAVEAIRERQVAERVPPRARARAGPARWVGIAGGAAALVVAAVLFLRPEPLPPPALTPQAAVKGFWESMVQGHYQGATVYYPALVEKYGSRRQAALYLEQTFGEDPPTTVSVGEPEEISDSDDLRVGYEVWRRSGRPRRSEFIVRHSGGEAGYVIVYGP